MERFWIKVNKNPSISKHHPDLGGCWEWTAYIYKNGYGYFGGAKEQYAHRMSWFLINGEVPNKLYVLHRCDNRKCVNPEHLFLGTAKDNTKDMISKGRAFNNGKEIQAKKTHCKKGHPYRGHNLIYENRKNGVARICRACGRLKSKKWRDSCRKKKGLSAD